MSYKILVVDDEAANLRILERLFRTQYTVVTAESGAEGLEMLNRHDIALIISDQRMPGMTGIEFLKRAAETRPHTVRIILTGYTDVNALVEAINSGVVYKYATKPWVNEDLKQTVIRALQHYETIKKQYELQMRNQRLETRLEASIEGFVKIAAALLDAKEANGHSERTARYAIAVGRQFNLEADELEQLSVAARLHEIAHIRIPDHVLRKMRSFSESELRENELTEGEYLNLRRDFESGLRMLESVPDLEDAASAIRYQHEHFDGKGFPSNLAGEQIPLSARIIAVADAYDTMTSSLSAGQNNDSAIARLRAAAGKKFDPEVVKAFCSLQREDF
jgi:adenylate cyclase